MHRSLLLAALAVVVVAGPASAGAPAPGRSALDKFTRSDVVVIGKVTAVEKDTIDATLPYPGSKDKVAYKVAVVKIESGLAGANGLTHIKVGFVPNPKPDPNFKPDPRLPPRARQLTPELAEGQEALLYLSKHPTADFYVMPVMNPPSYADNSLPGKLEFEQAKKCAAVLADPMKGLKSDKAAVRAETAAMLVAKYRAYPEFATKIEDVAIGADESKLILKTLAEVAWDGPALLAFSQLGLTEKDGWKQPAATTELGFNAVVQEAFVKWLDGPGKDYQIKKYVPK